MSLGVENLSKSFGSRELWRGISFEVSRGKIFGITGPSGGGKTTLLNCLGALEKPTSGNIFLNGRSISGLSVRKSRRLWAKDIGFLFQDYALVDRMNVRSNVSMGVPHLIGRRGLDDGISSALAGVGLPGCGVNPTYQLSGGEQQRVALVRLMLKSPSLVLADEPTGSLDALNEEMVLKHLRSFAKQGSMVVVASHSNSVLECCDQVLEVGLH